MEEKHGLWLFCAFILSWTLIKWANAPPERPPVEIPRRDAPGRAAPPQAAFPVGAVVANGGPAPAAPGTSPAAPPPAPGAGATSPPSAPSDASAGGSEAEPGPAAASASPHLAGGRSWELPPSGGSRGASAVSPRYGRAAPGGEPPAPGAAPAPNAATAAGAPAARAAGPASRRAAAAATQAAAAADTFGRLPPMGSPGAPPRPDLDGGGAGGASAPGPETASAGGGDGGGGGGGGASVGGDSAAPPLSGAGMPDARPHSSAGKPDDAGSGAGAGAGGAGATAGAAPGGGPVSSSGPGPSGPAGGSPPEVADVKATVGTPRVSGDQHNVDMFALKPGGPKVVPTFVVNTGAAKVVSFTAKMAIDADGAGGWAAHDPTGQNQTSLRYPGGASLNPGQIPFIVVPLDFGRSHPDVKLGDYAAVSYGGKTVYAIVGDKGPAGVVGEGSIALAKALGINSDPRKGGADSGVTYVIIPGSRDAAPPKEAGAIQTAGEALFRKAKVPVT